MEKRCPICEKPCDVQGWKNHIRLTNGRGHGPAGSMPDELADNESTLSVTDGPVSATDVRARGFDHGEETTVQEALDRAVEQGNEGIRRIDARVAKLERRVEKLESVVEPTEPDQTTCPNCGYEEPEPLEGELALEYADFNDVYDWICPNCKEPFTD